MMAANRFLLMVLLSLGAAVVFWFNSGERFAGSFIRPSSKRTFFDLSGSLMKQERADVQSFFGPTVVPSPETHIASQQRSLLRIGENIQNEGVENDTEQTLPARNLLNQVWYSNPIQGKLREGINKGILNVLIFLAGWFTFMCTVGAIMRCYLCCETIWSDRNYTPISLFNRFADREEAFDNESEGIALDSLSPRDIENHGQELL